MRPGQQAPESRLRERRQLLACDRFNEARAASPGIPLFLGGGEASSTRFNEARAASPGILDLTLVVNPVTGASMRPGQQAPESVNRRLDYRVTLGASMRPGQQAPESFEVANSFGTAPELQ